MPGPRSLAAERPASLAGIAAELAACQRCAIGCNGTHAVAGEGRADAALMIVGEQPGDSEELAGRAFVGPAGQLLRAHLGDAGIDLRQAWLTNAVKHFKFVPKGKRRLHQNPTAKEIDTCRWWVESERALVQPRLVLGAGGQRGARGAGQDRQRAGGARAGAAA